MFNLFRLGSCVLALLAVAAAATAVQPDWARDLAPDGWIADMENFVKQWDSARLDEETLIERQHTDTRVHATRMLLAGHSTLFETAAIFYRLNRERGAAAFCLKPADYSDEEWACHQVIEWAEKYSSGDPAPLVQRLEEEVRQQKERYGTLLLPDTAADAS